MSQEKNQERNFDIRTLDSQLQRGTITQKEYDQYLKSLPNDEGNYEEVVIQEDVQDEFDDEDFEEEDEVSDESNE